jgi:dipeptidyl aminopeptidase/acylaminoacyl peptidase
MKSINLLASMFAVVAIMLSCTSETVPPLIDREIFFEDPVIIGGQLSPDGMYLSFLKPYNGTRNIWIKPIEASFDDALPMSSETLRPISNYWWSRDGKYVLYIQDKGGDENFNIWAIDPSQVADGFIPEARNLTNLVSVRAMIFHVARNDEDLLYVGINDRDKAWHDLYSLRISTGELILLWENKNRYTGWVFDNDDKLRLAMRSEQDGTSEIWSVTQDGEKLIYSWSVFETAYPVSFTKDNSKIYFVSNVGENQNLTQLYLMDPNTGELEFDEGDPEGKVDFGGILISDKTLEKIVTTYTDEYTRRYFFNKLFEAHYKKVKDKFPGMEVGFFRTTANERYWLVSVWSDTKPSDIYLYDMEDEVITYQYSPRPKLQSEYLSKMKSIKYPSSDGMEIQAYLTLPKGFGKKNLPLVVMPHGGPWYRDSWTFNSYTQFLANRGYAVLQPNFRGSTGFGKEFLNAGNNQWGDLMQDDITWGVKYLIDKGIADKERVAIFGGSYGGYATLAGLAFTPEVYACGVSFVGPSNLITLLKSIPPYWEAGRITFHKRMGDPTTDEGLDQIKRQSPLFSADKISAPLMVVQGQNDPRVKKAESDQIVIALRDRNFPVVYLNAPDEGHGFARPINNLAFFAAMEKFLANHIKGRYQESMSEEVSKRLNEITVDVNTVVLPEGY